MGDRLLIGDLEFLLWSLLPAQPFACFAPMPIIKKDPP